jgi:hypothetical protein
VVPNAFLGLECCEHTDYDGIFVCGHSLKHINAFDFLRIFRSVGGMAPIFIMSEYFDDIEIEDYFPNGNLLTQFRYREPPRFNGKIHKPFTKKEFCSTVVHLFQSLQSRQLKEYEQQQTKVVQTAVSSMEMIGNAFTVIDHNNHKKNNNSNNSNHITASSLSSRASAFSGTTPVMNSSSSNNNNNNNNNNHNHNNNNNNNNTHSSVVSSHPFLLSGEKRTPVTFQSTELSTSSSSSSTAMTSYNPQLMPVILPNTLSAMGHSQQQPTFLLVNENGHVQPYLISSSSIRGSVLIPVRNNTNNQEDDYNNPEKKQKKTIQLREVVTTDGSETPEK